MAKTIKLKNTVEKPKAETKPVEQDLTVIKIPQKFKDLVGETIEYPLNGKIKLYVLTGIRWSTRFKFNDDEGNAFLAIELYLTENGKDYFWSRPVNTEIKNPIQKSE